MDPQFILINVSRAGIQGWGGNKGGTQEAGAKTHNSKVSKATVWSPQGSDDIL